ncbi:hypothetical protein C8R43DRAFT_1136408 [Mycena crocata]|nr:hypothetical protein C8R43DRAFT_1136408 [Mycena crocata]
MKTPPLPWLLLSSLLVSARPSPDSPVTVLAAPEFEGFVAGGIESIFPIGTAAAGDVTTYEIFRTTHGTFKDEQTATLLESSGGYTLIWDDALTDFIPTSTVTTWFVTDACTFIGGSQAVCSVQKAEGGATFPLTTVTVEALATLDTGFAPSTASPASSTSASASKGSATGPALNPSRTTGAASSADPASTSSKPNAGFVRYGKGYRVTALLFVAALLLVF